MSEQAFIDAVIARGVISAEQLYGALAAHADYTSVGGRLFAAGVARDVIVGVLAELTGLERAPERWLASPRPGGYDDELARELLRVGAVPLGDVDGALAIAVISVAAHEELRRLRVPPHRAFVALEQDLTLVARAVQQLATVSISLGESVSAESIEGGVRGDLEGMSLAAIARLLAPAREDAEVMIEAHDGTRGVVGFRAGEIVFAQAGARTGRPALFELSVARQGRFRIRYGERPFVQNLDGVRASELKEPPVSAPAPVALPPVDDVTLLDHGFDDDGESATIETPYAEGLDDTPSSLEELTRLGAEVAGFRVGPLLGRGAGGVVHQATRIESGEEVALKLLSPSHSRSPQFMLRARRETSVQASLRHRNIVSVLSFGNVGDVWYLAAELAHGGPLSRKLKEAGPLPSGLVALLLRDLLAGVEHAHQSHVIHRDIKPGNVLLSSEGRAKLTDFGLARSTYDPVRTKPGVVLGTPTYMSPEQVQGGEVDHRSDFFSLATLAIEMLSGRSPFKDDNIARSMLAVMRGQRAPLIEMVPTVLPLLEEVIEDMGALDPRERPEKAGLLLDRVDPLAYAVERCFPNVAKRFVENPKGTARWLRREEAELELLRAQYLASRGGPLVPQAAFAAWRASELEPALDGAHALLERLAAENGYRFRPSANEHILALEEKRERDGKDIRVLRELAALYREERNVPRLVARLCRLTRLDPLDHEARSALIQMVGDPVGPYRRR